jgi:hypothetical protein
MAARLLARPIANLEAQRYDITRAIGAVLAGV